MSFEWIRTISLTFPIISNLISKAKRSNQHRRLEDGRRTNDTENRGSNGQSGRTGGEGRRTRGPTGGEGRRTRGPTGGEGRRTRWRKVDEPAAKADEPVEKVEESVEKMDGSSSKAEESSATSDDQSSPTDQSSTTSNESPVKKKEVSEKKPAASTAKKAESSSSAVRGVRLQKREVPIKSIKDVRPVLQEALKQLKYPLIKKLEAQTGMKREMLFYIACGFIAFFLMFGPCNEAICNLIGIAYPAHQSLMAVRSKTKADDTQWLMYWCSFALFSLCDFILTPFVGPLFVLLKVTCLLYLAVPQTYGAHNFYVSCVDPLMDWAAKRIKI
uniref:Receptor expression-enhancing protein n=1 Tax=Globodera pallida TaxID=36090 RepID=A0A183BP11_GLOPA